MRGGEGEGGGGVRRSRRRQEEEELCGSDVAFIYAAVHLLYVCFYA